MQTSVKFWSVISIGMALCAVPLHAEVLYMANTDGNSISAYKIAETGALTQVAGSPFPSGKWPFAVAVDVPGHLVFTANMGDDTISIYRIDANGGLTHLAESSAGVMPAALAVDPFGRFLYVTNLDGTKGDTEGDPGTFDNVTSYRIGVDGTLTAASTAMTGYSPLSITADPTGQFVYVGNVPIPEHLQTISGYRVNGNGSLTQLPGSPFLNGEGAQSMAVDPLGRFLYAAGEFDFALDSYKIAGGTGVLTELPAFHPGDGFAPSNSVVVGPFGRFVYQLGTPGYPPSNSAFTIYRVGPTGLTLASTQTAGLYSDAMAVDPSERFLYVGSTTVGNGVSAYSIGATGSLTPIASLPLGFAPGAMAVSPFWAKPRRDQILGQVLGTQPQR
jgi:6-phosphogluconolactonase (cycloisomerase 2 family)